MKALADRYLDNSAIDEAGLLSTEGVKNLFEVHDNPDTTAATQVQLDAVINHMLSVQILHQHFVATDIPARAHQKAQELGWLVQ